MEACIEAEEKAEALKYIPKLADPRERAEVFIIDVLNVFYIYNRVWATTIQMPKSITRHKYSLCLQLSRVYFNFAHKQVMYLAFLLNLFW